MQYTSTNTERRQITDCCKACSSDCRSSGARQTREPAVRSYRQTLFIAELGDVTKCWKVIDNELEQLHTTAIALRDHVHKTTTKLLHTHARANIIIIIKMLWTFSTKRYNDSVKSCITWEVEGITQRGRPKKIWCCVGNDMESLGLSENDVTD